MARGKINRHIEGGSDVVEYLNQCHGIFPPRDRWTILSPPTDKSDPDDGGRDGGEKWPTNRSSLGKTDNYPARLAVYLHISGVTMTGSDSGSKLKCCLRRYLNRRHTLSFLRRGAFVPCRESAEGNAWERLERDDRQSWPGGLKISMVVGAMGWINCSGE